MFQEISKVLADEDELGRVTNPEDLPEALDKLYGRLDKIEDYLYYWRIAKESEKAPDTEKVDTYEDEVYSASCTASTQGDLDILYRRILDVLTSQSSWYDDEFGDLFDDFAKQCARVILTTEDVDPATVDIKFVRDNLRTIETKIKVGSTPVKLIWEYEDPLYGVVVG